MFWLIFWLALIGVSIGIIATVFVWNRVQFTWLNTAASTIVLLYPFEYLPTLDIGAATLKPSFVATLITVWILAILAIKRDATLMQTKIKPLAWWLFAFITATLPSYFIAVNPTRFWTTFIAIIGVFATAFILTHFLKNPVNDAKRLVIVMVAVCVFATYQFVGDMLGLPTSITFLRPQYTKIIFGFPRVHATALEPLLFAGQLFFPILFLWNALGSKLAIWKLPQRTFNWLQKLPSIGEKLWKWEETVSGFSQCIALLFVGGIFVSTISKGAFFALAVTLLLMMLISMKNIDFRPILRSAAVVFVLAAIFLNLAATQSQAVSTSLNEVYANFYGTILGQTGSIAEREAFQDVAWLLVKQYPLTGVGGGNFADTGARLLPQYSTNNPGSLIVNNVYLEVFVEFGLLTLLIFIALIIWILTKAWHFLQLKPLSHTYITVLSSSFAFVAYLVQWSSFSPLYITPIFILIGIITATHQTDS